MNMTSVSCKNKPLHDEDRKYHAQQEIGKALLAGGDYTIVYESADANSFYSKIGNVKLASGFSAEPCRQLTDEWIKKWPKTCCLHLLRGLAHLHSLGVWHGNISPSCLYLVNNRVKLGDYDHSYQVNAGLIKSEFWLSSLTEEQVNYDVRMAAYTMWSLISKAYSGYTIRNDSPMFQIGLASGYYRPDCQNQELDNLWTSTTSLGCLSRRFDSHLMKYLFGYTLSEKPSALDVQKHPYFWNKEKVSMFLCLLYDHSAIHETKENNEGLSNLTFDEKRMLLNELPHLHYSVKHQLSISNRVIFPGIMNVLLNQLPEERLFDDKKHDEYEFSIVASINSLAYQRTNTFGTSCTGSFLGICN